MPIDPNPPAPSATRPEWLPAGQQRLLWLDAGAELRCLDGALRLRPAWIACDAGSLPGDRELRAHHAWRSDRGQWLQVAALRSAAYRLDAPPGSPADALNATALQPKGNHPEPRGAGWLVEAAAGGFRRVAIYLKRGRRAA